jgi:hypothetical protein
MSKKPRRAIGLSSSSNSPANISITPKNIFKSLDYLRDTLPGVREMAYRLMAWAWKVVLLLRGDKRLMKKFILKAKLKAKKGKGNIADAVMVYVMRAETNSMKQMAWKRSRVLLFLHEQGVKIGKMASEIEARGGIEAIYKQAVKSKPLRVLKPAKKRASETESSVQKAKKNGLSKPSAETDKDAENRSPRTNDQRAMLLVSIKLSDRDALSEMPLNAKAGLTIKRNENQNGAKFTVLRVKELPEKSQL